MIKNNLGSSLAAAAGLLLATACSNAYDVGENMGTGGAGATTNTATGGSNPGIASGGSGGSTDVPVPVATRMINGTPVACTEWGKGVSVAKRSNPNHDRLHILTSLGNGIWGSAPTSTASTPALEAYYDVLQTSGDAYCIARHMMIDPRANIGLAAFFESWLKLTNPDRFPGTPEQQTRLAALNVRAINFGVQQAMAGNGNVKSLFTGLRPIDLAPDWGSATPVNSDTRFANGGLLSEAAVVMRSSTGYSEIHVARIAADILKTFLCTDLPPPPPDVSTSPPSQAQPGTSYRNRYLEVMNANPSCLGCHKLTDGIGLAMDVFDGMGRVQPSDRYGIPYGNFDNDQLLTQDGVPVENPVAVANYVANHENLVPCFARAVGDYFGVNDGENNNVWYTDSNANGQDLFQVFQGKSEIPDIFATVVRFTIETPALQWY